MPLTNTQQSRKEENRSVLALYVDAFAGKEDILEELGIRYQAGVNYRGHTSKGEQVDFIFRKLTERETLQELAKQLLMEFSTVNRIDITP